MELGIKYIVCELETREGREPIIHPPRLTSKSYMEALRYCEQNDDTESNRGKLIIITQIRQIMPDTTYVPVVRFIKFTDRKPKDMGFYYIRYNGKNAGLEWYDGKQWMGQDMPGDPRRPLREDLIDTVYWLEEIDPYLEAFDEGTRAKIIQSDWRLCMEEEKDGHPLTPERTEELKALIIDLNQQRLAKGLDPVPTTYDKQPPQP